MKKLLFITALSMLAVADTFAQFGYNESSVRPILEDDIMFRKTLFRRINLKEKQNKPFFADGFQIGGLMIKGCEEKELQAYVLDSKDNSTVTKMSPGDTAWTKATSKKDASGNVIASFYPDEMSILEIKEDIIFDRRRSRMYYDIQSIALVVPGGDAVTGDDAFIAVFKFKDVYKFLKDRYRKSNQTEALWYNPQNNRRHMCLADAFDLRLFSSRITKISNPDNLFLGEIATQYAKNELYLSQETENELMEFEHNLWEF
jgi:gliding motility associated protien GldN